MTDAADDENTTQGRHLGAGVKYILAAGAVATALGAIIGLGQTVLPDDPKPAEQMSATISGLQVDPKVPLAEYLEEIPEAARPSGRKASVAGTVFASASLAEYTPPPVVSSSESESESEPETETETKTQSETETETEPPVTTPQPPPPVTTTRPPPPPPGNLGTEEGQSLPALPEGTQRLLEQVEYKPLEEVLDVPAGEVQMDYVTEILTDEKDAPRDEVRRMLTASRLGPANTTGTGPKKLSPLGVVVNFSAQIDGYRGKQSVVRWSLFDARDRTRMPQPWLRNREALRLVPEAGSDRGSLAVWVPLPRKRGPYFVRLELLSDRGARLDKADTKRFDR